MTYTSGKSSRLLNKDNVLFGVKTLLVVPRTNTLLLLRDATLILHNFLTNEDIPLSTLNSDPVSVHMCGDDLVCVLLKDITLTHNLEVFSLEKGKHIKTISLGDRPITWVDIRSPYEAYYADDHAIKSIDVEKATVAKISPMKQTYSATCISVGRSARMVTLSVR